MSAEQSGTTKRPDAPELAVHPFWFAMWQTTGWSRQVARIWAKDTAYRCRDESYLDVVLPTLASDQRRFVERVLQDEIKASPRRA